MAGGDDRVGTEVGGRYRIASLIGEGGFAYVYRAVHLVTGKAVALKVLHPIISQIAGGRERFLREMKLIGALNHPHIVGIYDAGFEEDGTGYAAFELLRGETLAELLMRQRKLTPVEIGPVLCDVLRALAEAHKQEVIHRDIKPENIFLSRGHNDKLITKVLDFGIAYSDDTAAGGQKLTQTGMLLGSPTYMAPEQASGDPVSTATDLWAVGVVLFEALSGDVPFKADSAMDVLKQILWEPMPPVPDDVPRPLRAIIERAMQKRAALRYPSADAMIDAMESAIGKGIPSVLPPRPRKDPRAESDFDADFDAIVANVYGKPDPIGELTFSSIPAAPLLPPPPPAPPIEAPSHPQRAPSAMLPEVRVIRPESVVHTSFSGEVIDRTHLRVSRKLAVSVGGATVAILGVTAALLSGGYRMAHPRTATPPTAVQQATENAPETSPPPGAEGPAAQANAVRVPRPEITTPVPVGEQLRVAFPEGLASVDLSAFVDHIVTPAIAAAVPSAGTASAHGHALAVGFASCAGDKVYLRPDGVAGQLRAASVGLTCDGPSLSFTLDVDGDRVQDLVAVNHSRNGLEVISTRGLSVIRRIALPGVHSVVGGLVLDRNEPGAVAYVPRDGGGGELVAVGLRRGRVAWRTERTIPVGDPIDDGLSVGPDLDGDHLPDIAVGTVVQGHRCVEVLSGATGVRRWPEPACAEGTAGQTLSLGPDSDEDARGDVVVGSTAGNRVRLLSGANGHELRVLSDPDESSFGVPAILVPDLSRGGFAEVVVGHVGGEQPAVEIYSSNDGHRVGTWALPRTASLPHLNVQFLEGFAFQGGRSVIVATPEGGISVIAAGLRSERGTQEGAGP